MADDYRSGENKGPAGAVDMPTAMLEAGQRVLAAAKRDWHPDFIFHPASEAICDGCAEV